MVLVELIVSIIITMDGERESAFPLLNGGGAGRGWECCKGATSKFVG